MVFDGFEFALNPASFFLLFVYSRLPIAIGIVIRSYAIRTGAYPQAET